MKTLVITGISVVVLQKYDVLRRIIPVNPLFVDIGEVVLGSGIIWKVPGLGKGFGAGLFIDGALDLAERYLPAL